MERKYATLTLVLLVFLGAFLRLYGLAEESLWADELYTLKTASQGTLSEFFSYLGASDPHPPLYFLLIHFIYTPELSDFSLRLPSALFGIATIPLFFLFLRRSFQGALLPTMIGVALLSISPFHIWYSQEARPYAMQVFFVVLFLWMTVEAYSCQKLDERRVPFLLFLQGFALLLASLTHYYSLLLLPIALLSHIYFFKIVGSPSKGLKRLLLPVVSTWLFILPVVIFAMMRFTSGEGTSWLPGSITVLHALVDAPKAQMLGPHWLPYGLGPLLAGLCIVYTLLIAGAIALLRVPRGERRPMVLYMVLIGFFILFVFPLLLSFLRGVVYYGQRYLIIALPLFILLSVSSLLTNKKPVRFASSCLLLLLVGLQSWWLVDYYRFRQKRTWDTLADTISKSGLCDRVVVGPGRVAELLERYASAEYEVIPMQEGKPVSQYTGDYSCYVSLGNPVEAFEKSGYSREEMVVGEFTTHWPGQNLYFVYIGSSEN